MYKLPGLFVIHTHDTSAMPKRSGGLRLRIIKFKLKIIVHKMENCAICAKLKLLNSDKIHKNS